MDTNLATPRTTAVAAALAAFVAACSHRASAGPVQQQTSDVTADPVPSLVCAPLVSHPAQLIRCGATGAGSVSNASRVQAQLGARMQEALASLTLTPDFERSQLVVTSMAPQFTALFGSRIVAPLTQAGLFTTTVRVSGLGAIEPALSLVVNLFGVVPGPCSLSVLDPAVSPFGGTFVNDTFTAFSGGSLAAAAALDVSAVNVATMPLTFFVSTPVAAAGPLICSGSVPLGCNGGGEEAHRQ